jgi:hypothetical protein
LFLTFLCRPPGMCWELPLDGDPRRQVLLHSHSGADNKARNNFSVCCV